MFFKEFLLPKEPDIPKLSVSICDFGAKKGRDCTKGIAEAIEYVSGKGGGGTATFYVSCLEDRIKVFMPSCAFAGFDDSISAMFHCTCNFVPHIREYFDMGDLSGLIAPKTLILVSGEQDDICPKESAENCFDEVQNTCILQEKDI